ncbi:MOS1T transposase, partial [Pseudoatta argentina]
MSKSIRNETCQILKSINNCDTESAENKILYEGVGEVKRFISENPDILITKADKGNTTVIMNRDNYREKMHEILNDQTTYNLIKKYYEVVEKGIHKLPERWEKLYYTTLFKRNLQLKRIEFLDTTCRDWFRRFKNNDFQLEDKERSGAPKKFQDKELEQLLDEKSRELLLQRQKRKGFFASHRIVTGDEKWIHYDNPKRRKSWRKPGHASTSSARPNIHAAIRAKT